MRDYYAEYIGKKSENMTETELTKLTKAENNPFVSFVSEQTDVNLKKFCLDDLLKNVEMKEQFEFEIEERTAIMIFDGGMSEAEAIKLARENVKQTWLAHFGE